MESLVTEEARRTRRSKGAVVEALAEDRLLRGPSGHFLGAAAAGSVIPLIAARTEEQFRDNLAATDVHLSQQHLDRLDALSRPTLGFPADVMRDASVVSGIYGAQLPDIDDPRAQAVLRTTTGT